MFRLRWYIGRNLDSHPSPYLHNLRHQLQSAVRACKHILRTWRYMYFLHYVIIPGLWISMRLSGITIYDSKLRTEYMSNMLTYNGQETVFTAPKTVLINKTFFFFMQMNHRKVKNVSLTATNYIQLPKSRNCNRLYRSYNQWCWRCNRW